MTKKSLGPPCPSCGNPINPGTGTKFQDEKVYSGAGTVMLREGYAYNSFSLEDGGFGPPYGRYGVNNVGYYGGSAVDYSAGDLVLIGVSRPDGKVLQFSKPSSGNVYVGDADRAERLEKMVDASNNFIGWRFTSADGEEVELFDTVGRLLSITNRAGLATSLSYADGSGGIMYGSAPNALGYQAPACNAPAGFSHWVASAGAPPQGILLCVTDSFGRQLNYQTDNFQDATHRRIVKTVDPAGGEYNYEYDGASGGCVGGTGSGCGKDNLTKVTFPDGKTRVYYYNEASLINGGAACSGLPDGLPNALTGIVDENGQRFASWAYDCSGRATMSEHAGGANAVTLAYNPDGSATVTDALGAVRTYGFVDSLNVPRNTGITGDVCPSCGSAAETFDANANVASRTDWDGNRTNYSYDLARNLETQRVEGLTSAGATTAQTRTISTQWDTNFRLPTRIAEPLRITTNVYDADGTACGTRGALCSKTVQATTDANGSQGFSASPTGSPRVWTYTYNANGSVLTVNGPRTDVADTTTYTYYANNDPDLGKRGNVATITNALGQVTQITAYSANGQPLTIVDPNGLTTMLTYDARMRLTSRTVGAELTSYDYDGVGQLTKVTLPDGSYLSYSYDAAHRLTGMQDNLGNKIAYTLDVMGNRTQEQVFDPANNLAQTRSRVYSTINRLYQEIGAANQTTTYTYDDQGNVTGVTDPLNHTTTNAYDALNRLIQVTDPNTGVTHYAYNGNDALTGVTDPRSLVTGYTVDGLGNLTQQASPDTGTTSNTYDAAGNLLTQTDAKNQTTAYAYDALNRVTSITFQDGSKQTYAYDQGTNGLGRLTGITETDPASQVTDQIAYAYDQHGRVTSETRTVNGVPYVTAYSYDSAGRMSGITYPSGRTVAYTFDALGRVSEVDTTKDSNTQVVVQGVTYQPFGGVKGYTLGNGQVYSRTIDQDGRVASYTLGASTYDISFDAASRITSIAEAGNPANTNTYGYDSLDRLTSAVLPSTSYGYSYDGVGNRLSKTVGASTDTYTYSPTSNQLASLTPATGPARTFTFDANGSTTNDGVNQYAYDTRGRMVQATTAQGTTTYQVNALGQRFRKTNSSGDRVFLYDTRGHLIAETDPGGGVKREILYLGDIPVGVVQ